MSVSNRTNFHLLQGAKKLGIFFGILYIESHCVNIFILIHKTTYSIYGKVDIAFLLSLQCPVNIAFTFDILEYKWLVL